MEDVATTKKEREIMRHAMGLNRGKKPYRNYFNTDEGCPDFIICEGLVAKGLMIKRPAGSVWPGFNFFVTFKGADEIGLNIKSPKIAELLPPKDEK